VEESQRETGWRKLLWWTASVFLGAVFLLAVWGKMLEPGLFIDQIRLEGLDFLLSAAAVAVLALALEAGLGVALVLGVRHRSVLYLTLALVVFFLFLTGRNYWLVSQGLRDPEASCGCFGSLIERSPAEAFWQDLLLLVPPLLIIFWLLPSSQGSTATPKKRMAFALIAALVVGGYTWNSAALKFHEVANEIASIEQDAAFRPSPSYQLKVNGQNVTSGRVFESEASVELVVTDPTLPGPVLIDPRTREFGWIDPATVTWSGEEALSLPQKKKLNEVGNIAFGDGGITFQLGPNQYVVLMG